jgi:hypothetical protein
MPDYTSLVTQARRLRELGLASGDEITARQRARYAAYLWLAHESQGQILLDDWCLILLRACETAQDEGERRFVLRILKAIVDAPQQLGDEDGR